MKRNALQLLAPILLLAFQVSGVTVFSNLDTADNRVGVRKTSLKERVRYSTFWNTDALPDDHLKIALDGVELLDVPAESIDQGHWFDVTFSQKYEPQTVTLSHGLLSYSARFANGYTVRFDANAGVGLMEPQGFAYGERNNLSRNLFTRVGYTFTGWSSNAGVSEVKYGDTENVSDVTDALGQEPGSLATLYAQWRPNVCHLVFHGNGGGGFMDGQDLSYDRKATLTSNQFVRDGYVFCGWARSAEAEVLEFGNGVEVLNIESSDEATIDLYAVWSKLKPEIADTAWTVEKAADNRDVVRKAATVEEISYGTYWNTDAPEGTVLEVSVDGAVVKSTATGSSDVAGTFECTLPLRYEVQTLAHEHGLLLYTARFANGYTVRFDANGGLGLMANQTFAYGERKNIVANQFTKLGYTFAGWAATAGTAEIKYENTEVVEDVTDALELEPGSLVTLYAQWRPNAYSVRFDANGGMGFADSQYLRYDTAAKLNANVFTLTNNIFTGWSEDPEALIPTYGNGGEVKNLTAADNSEIVLYAVWSRLRPDAAGTIWAEERAVDNRSSVRKASPTELISYGTYWNTDAPEGTPLTVTLDRDVIKATASGSSDVAGVFEFAMPLRYGVQTMKHEHGLLLYTAKFANGYTVRFDPNGGEGEMDVQEFAYGERKNIASSQFVKLGYTFRGWAQKSGIAEVMIENAECVEDITDAFEQEPGSLVTLYAQWRANGYKVRFHANGGKGFADDQSMVYDAATTLNGNVFSRTNCIFAGWSEDPEALLPTYANGSSVKNLSSTDEGVVDLYAVWSRLRPDPAETVWTDEATADNRSCVRKTSEVEFISYGTGWNTDAIAGSVLTVSIEGEIVKTTVDGDGVFECAFPLRYGVQTMTHEYGLLSYSAKFANGYTVRFDANGGDGAMEIQGFAYGERKNISPNLFSKRGYNFAGWSVAPGSSTIKYYDSECVEDITDALELEPGTMVVLYAQWKPNIYTILFGANGGSGWMDSIRAAYDEVVSLVANLFTKAGQIFAGWSTDSSATVSIYADKESVLNLTDQDGGEVQLHAVWSQAKPNEAATVWSEPVIADNRNVVRKAAVVEEISYGTYWNTDAPDGTELSVTVDGEVVKSTATGSSDVAGTFECALPLRYEVQTLIHEHGLLLYTARFANGYTVRFDGNGGLGLMEPQCFAYGERKNIARNQFAREGYTFAGWSTSSGVGEILYQDAESVEDITDAVNLEPGSMVMLYAQWRPNVCRLEFYGNGGAGYMDGQTLQYDNAASISRNGFSKDGYVFCGWAKRADAELPDYWNGATVVNVTNEDNAVVSLYAMWSLAKPEAAGTVWADERNADNRDAIRKASTSELISYGTYWNTDAPIGTVLTVARDGTAVKTTNTGSSDVAGVFDCEMPLVYGVQTLTHEHGLLSYSAKFANGYMVKFNANGGVGEMAQQGFAYGERKNIFANQFSKVGYGFAGWGVAPNNNVVKFYDAECVEDITDALGVDPGSAVLLSAVWKPNTYTVRFNANGGSGEMPDQSVNYDNATALSRNMFTREGYVFAGWARNRWAVSGTYSDMGEILNLSAVDGAVVDLYAVWSVQSPDPSETVWTDIIAMLLDANFKNIVFADESNAIALTDDGVKISGSTLGDDNESVFSFTTEGNGQVSFEWRVSSEGGADFGWWSLDGVIQESNSGKTMNWTKVLRIVSDGKDHVWSFGYTKDASDEGGEDCAIFRDFKWTPEGELVPGGDASAAIMVSEGKIVIDGAKLGDSASASFVTNTVGNGKLVFRWTVSSEKDCDLASYSKDGVVVKSMSGKNNPWISETNQVSDAAAHVWTFTYTKDGANKSGSDSMTIVDLEWIPYVAPDDPIPDIGDTPSAAEIQSALTGSADAKLTENITDVETYNAYRDWATTIGAQAVKESPNAWLSFALQSDKLIEKAPVQGDLKIDDFTPSVTDGGFDMTVSLDGVDIGSEASKENLKKVFGIEGATSLSGDAFSSTNVELEFGTPVGGKVKCTAVPKDTSATSFFMKMKLK